jgi:hypothetical protein
MNGQQVVKSFCYLLTDVRHFDILQPGSVRLTASRHCVMSSPDGKGDRQCKADDYNAEISPKPCMPLPSWKHEKMDHDPQTHREPLIFNLGRKRVPLPQPATKGETYGSADTGHARHLGKRDAGLRRNREKGWFTQPVS